MLCRRKIFFNWRMEGSRASVDLCAAMLKGRCFNAEVVLLVPYPLLDHAVRAFAGTAVGIGAQDCSRHAKGGFTGEVPAQLLRDLGATHVLLNHSDRRRHHGETNESMADKVERALASQLSPVVCLGETEAERDEGKTRRVLQQQVAAVLKRGKRDCQRVSLVYEPIWAHEVGDSATPGAVEEAHRMIRHLIEMNPHGGHALSTVIPILGGMAPHVRTAQALLATRYVDGALVSGAELDLPAFASFLEMAAAL